MAEVYSSLYKGNVHVTTPFKTTHKAIDLGNYKTRNPIYSANKLGEGTVSYTASSYKDSTGKLWTDSWVVYIKYDNGMTCRMFHGYPKDAVVKRGQRVKPGVQVYRTGNSGNSKGDHLHYVLLNSKGVPTDPAPYVLNDKVLTPPNVSPCEEYKKEIITLTSKIKTLEISVGDLQGIVIKNQERIEFLESTLAIREKELTDLEGDYDRIKTERDNFEKQYLALVTELNELKKGRDDWINRLADVLHKLFGSK